MRLAASKPSASRTKSLAELDLLDFIPAVSPRYAAPHHLAPLLALFERIARGERVFAVVSCPPRHGKTETELHAIAWLLARRPALQLAFVGYAQRFAETKSRKARGLAREAGVPLADDAQSRQDWRTGVADGGLWASSIGGALTGTGFQALFIDDPVKDRATAESAAMREHTWEWFTDTAFTRLEPNGSCIVTQTRWHSEDLAGRLLKQGWESVSLPAINDGTDPRREIGEALWPERWPVEALEDIRKHGNLGDYGWYSLYQGQPRPRGGALFKDVTTYASVPDPARYVVGLDFAYTAKSRADYSVAVVLAKAGTQTFVREVLRHQVAAPEFAQALRVLKARYPLAKFVAYVGGTEKGVVDLLNKESKLDITATPARADKFVRAQAAAAAWNQGTLSVPAAGAPWLDAFLEEVCSFTGVGDAHDDQVDALVSAFDNLSTTPLPAPTELKPNLLNFAPPRFLHEHPRPKRLPGVSRAGANGLGCAVGALGDCDARLRTVSRKCARRRSDDHRRPLERRPQYARARPARL